MGDRWEIVGNSLGNRWGVVRKSLGNRRDMLHTAARELRSSIPATGRAPCHTIALYSVGCVRNMLTHASPKPTESSSRKAAESEVHQPKTPRRGNSGRCRSTAYKNQHEPIGHMLSCTQTTLQREQTLIVFQKRPGNLPSPREISCVWLGQCSLQWGWFPERVADPTECKHSLVPSSEVPC